MTILLWAALGVVVAYIGGVAIFCLVTWRWVARLGPPRSHVDSLREFTRELLIVALVQPLLPLFYLIGRGREHASASDVPVILVHGYFQNRVDFLYLRRALRARGVRPIYAFNYPWWDSITNNSARLERFIERVASKANQVRLVGHSMGGLVALDYVVHRAPSKRVACCVTLGTPHSGVIFRGPLLGAAGRDLRAESLFFRERAQCAISVPCLSIASEHDNIVFPAKRAALQGRGGVDWVVAQRAHLGILFDAMIADRVSAFLESPDMGGRLLEPAGIVATQLSKP